MQHTLTFLEFLQNDQFLKSQYAVIHYSTLGYKFTASNHRSKVSPGTVLQLTFNFFFFAHPFKHGSLVTAITFASIAMATLLFMADKKAATCLVSK